MKDDHQSVDQIISSFLNANDFQTIESFADKLGDFGDKKAIEPLIIRLGDRITKIDGDIEDAICSSLVKLGVMKKTGDNLMFEFLGKEELDRSVHNIILDYIKKIPKKYLPK